MSEKFIAKMLCVIAVEYPRDIPIGDEEDSQQLFDLKAKLWQQELQRYDEAIVEQAVRDALRSSHFCPKLADIVDRAECLLHLSDPPPEEEWLSLSKVFNRVLDLTHMFKYTFVEANGLTQGQNARLEIDRIYNEELTDIQRVAVGSSPSGLIQASRQDGLEYEKARFIRNYDRIRETVSERKRAPEFAALLSGVFKTLE